MMRVLIFGLCLLVALAGPAAAADPPQRESDASTAEATRYDWTGFHLGLNASGIFGQSDGSHTDFSVDPKGGAFGLTLGGQWQFTRPFVLGLEGDWAWADLGASDSCAGDGTCETESNWLGTFRGRAGYAWDRFFPYLTGGMAVGDIEANRKGFHGKSDTNVGWSVGVGGEGVLGTHWSAKLEFLYVDLGDVSCSAGDCGVATKVDLRERMIRGGLNYRF
jgi:outer membrane immunogenic protein